LASTCHGAGGNQLGKTIGMPVRPTVGHGWHAVAFLPDLKALE
jgi:hypothetical protein